MTDWLEEKLKQASGVVERQRQKIGERADALIAREGEIEKATDTAFSPHEQTLDSLEKGLERVEDSLRVMNDPLARSKTGLQGDGQT